MPLFFFISGFLFALTVPNTKISSLSFGAFVKKKSIRLLIPFLFINTVIYIIKAGFIKDSSLMQNPIDLTYYSFIKSTLFTPLGFMWFLPTLFVIFMVVFLLRKSLLRWKVEQKTYLWVLMSGILISLTLDHFTKNISFMQISSAIHYMTYFLFGILYCDYKQRIDIFLIRYRYIIVPLFLIISIFLLFKGVFAAISGIIFSITISLVLEYKCTDRLVKLSSLCYAVFLLSYFPQMLIRGPIAHCFPSVNQYILSLISFLSGLLLPMIVALVFLKYKGKNSVIDKTGVLIGL